jgi:hypothetical protein
VEWDLGPELGGGGWGVGECPGGPGWGCGGVRGAEDGEGGVWAGGGCEADGAGGVGEVGDAL